MRYNKKNTKKTIQRKLTTRKRCKNNRSSFRTQYKIHKSYKQMKGGYVRTRAVKEILNSNPEKVINDPNDPNNRKLIGALIIKAYNELKQTEELKKTKYKDLPAIPHEPKTFTLDENNSIKLLKKMYVHCLNTRRRFQTNSGWDNENTPISTIFSGLQMLSPDEFSKWLRYILEGKVYTKILPFYRDNEFDKFKLLALSLHNLLIYANDLSVPTQTTPQPPPKYEKYVDYDNLQRVKDLCSTLVTKPDSILFGMGCVISLKRTDPKQWNWVNLDGSEQLTSNPYCAKRQAKRMMMRLNTNPIVYNEPLDKINVSMLTYEINELGDFINDKMKGIIAAMLSKVDIKKQFEETSEFKFVYIVLGKNYKYYEIKIFRSNIWQPDGGTTSTIPVIMFTLSAFDEDGICDFEFVYVCVIRRPPSERNPEPSWVNYDDDTFKAKVKEETFYKLTAEMTRLQSLLGGQTLNAPTTVDGTVKQYYDTVELPFQASRINPDGVTLVDSKPVVLNKGEDSEDPCTLILEYEQNEGQQEPVWKAAKATTTQSVAFKKVNEYLQERKKIKKLDNTSIRVFKISNNEKGNDNITVFVEVKKQDDSNGDLMYVYYQALGGERYEVYNNSDVARSYAALNIANYNWGQSTGIL